MSAQLGEKQCNESGPEAMRLREAQIKELKKQLPAGWKIVKRKELEKGYKFQDFRGALAFTIQVGNLAAEGHHPDILLSYGAVKITLSTHSARGLTENDFILAAKIDHR